MRWFLFPLVFATFLGFAISTELSLSWKFVSWTNETSADIFVGNPLIDEDKDEIYVCTVSKLYKLDFEGNLIWYVDEWYEMDVHLQCPPTIFNDEIYINSRSYFYKLSSSGALVAARYAAGVLIFTSSEIYEDNGTVYAAASGKDGDLYLLYEESFEEDETLLTRLGYVAWFQISGTDALTPLHIPDRGGTYFGLAKDGYGTFGMGFYNEKENEQTSFRSSMTRLSVVEASSSDIFIFSGDTRSALHDLSFNPIQGDIEYFSMEFELLGSFHAICRFYDESFFVSQIAYDILGKFTYTKIFVQSLNYTTLVENRDNLTLLYEINGDPNSYQVDFVISSDVIFVWLWKNDTLIDSTDFYLYDVPPVSGNWGNPVNHFQMSGKGEVSYIDALHGRFAVLYESGDVFVFISSTSPKLVATDIQHVSLLNDRLLAFKMNSCEAEVILYSNMSYSSRLVILDDEASCWDTGMYSSKQSNNTELYLFGCNGTTIFFYVKVNTSGDVLIPFVNVTGEICTISGEFSAKYVDSTMILVMEGAQHGIDQGGKNLVSYNFSSKIMRQTPIVMNLLTKAISLRDEYVVVPLSFDSYALYFLKDLAPARVVQTARVSFYPRTEFLKRTCESGETLSVMPSSLFTILHYSDSTETVIPVSATFSHMIIPYYYSHGVKVLIERDKFNVLTWDENEDYVSMFNFDRFTWSHCKFPPGKTVMPSAYHDDRTPGYFVVSGHSNGLVFVSNLSSQSGVLSFNLLASSQVGDFSTDIIAVRGVPTSESHYIFVQTLDSFVMLKMNISSNVSNTECLDGLVARNDGDCTLCDASEFVNEAGNCEACPAGQWCPPGTSLSAQPEPLADLSVDSVPGNVVMNMGEAKFALFVVLLLSLLFVAFFIIAIAVITISLVVGLILATKTKNSPWRQIYNTIVGAIRYTDFLMSASHVTFIQGYFKYNGQTALGGLFSAFYIFFAFGFILISFLSFYENNFLVSTDMLPLSLGGISVRYFGISVEFRGLFGVCNSNYDVTSNGFHTFRNATFGGYLGQSSGNCLIQLGENDVSIEKTSSIDIVLSGGQFVSQISYDIEYTTFYLGGETFAGRLKGGVSIPNGTILRGSDSTVFRFRMIKNELNKDFNEYLGTNDHGGGISLHFMESDIGSSQAIDSYSQRSSSLEYPKHYGFKVRFEFEQDNIGSICTVQRQNSEVFVISHIAGSLGGYFAVFVFLLGFIERILTLTSIDVSPELSDMPAEITSAMEKEALLRVYILKAWRYLKKNKGKTSNASKFVEFEDDYVEMEEDKQEM